MGNKSQIGGILSIISGFFGLLGAGSMILIIQLVYSASGMFYGYEDEILSVVKAVYGFIGVVLAVLAILSIIGGAFAIMKKYWGLALAGAIASIITFVFCGIPAVILVSMGKSEFKKPASLPPVSQPPPAV